MVKSFQVQAWREIQAAWDALDSEETGPARPLHRRRGGLRLIATDPWASLVPLSELPSQS